MTNNFKFLEDIEIDFPSKENLIDIIEKCESKILNKKFDNNDLVLMRKIGEIIARILCTLIKKDRFTTYIAKYENQPFASVLEIDRLKHALSNTNFDGFSLGDCLNILDRCKFFIKKVDDIYQNCLKRLNFLSSEIHSMDSNISIVFSQSICSMCDCQKSLTFLLSKLLNNEKVKKQSFDEKLYNKNSPVVEPTIPEQYFGTGAALNTKLNEVDSYVMPIVDFLLKQPDFFFRIPVYQRSYKWDVQDIDILLNDIDNVNEKNKIHFFGTLCCKRIKTPDNKNIYLRIIDGQQRLTTTMLLLCAAARIYQSLTGNDEENLVLENYIKKDAKLSLIFDRMNSQQVLIDDFNHIVDEIPNAFSNEENSFRANYNHLLAEFQKKFSTKSSLNKFIESFIQNFKVNVIELKEENFSVKDEMIIFSSLNFKGKKLNIAEIIKNELFSLCSEEILSSPSGETKLNVIWNTHLIDISKDKHDNLSSFFKSLVNYFQGREVNEDDQVTFVRLFMDSIKTLWNKYVKSNVPLENLNKNNFETLIQYIANYLNLYYVLVKPEDTLLSNGNPINKSPSIMGHFNVTIASITNFVKTNKITPLVPTAYLLFDSFLKDESRPTDSFLLSIKKYFVEMSLLLICHSVYSKQGDSQINRFFFEIVNNTRLKTYHDLNELTTHLKRQIIAKLGYEKAEISVINDNLCENYPNHPWWYLPVMIFADWDLSGFWKGNYAHYYYHIKHSPNNSKIIRAQKEHILPEKPKKWSDYIREHDGEKASLSFEREYERYKDKIGNIILLAPLANKKATNELFLQKKRDVYQDLTSKLYNNPSNNDIDVSLKQSWNFDQINTRSKALAKKIIEMFGIGKL